MIRRRSLSVPYVLWTIQTHLDELNRARRRTFHEINSLSLVRLIKFDVWPGPYSKAATSLHVIKSVFVHFLTVTARLRRGKLPNLSVYRGREQRKRSILLYVFEHRYHKVNCCCCFLTTYFQAFFPTHLDAVRRSLTSVVAAADYKQPQRYRLPHTEKQTKRTLG